MRRYIDRLHCVAGLGTGRGPVPAGHRERRHPAEAAPLGQLRVWTTLFGPFTVGTWERQAPPRGNPSGATPPAGRGGPGPFTPLRGPGCGEGSPAVTTPKGTLIITRVLAAGRGSVLGVVTARSFGTRWRPVSRMLRAHVAALFGRICASRDRAVDQPVRPRWGSASRRLDLGAEALVSRSPVASSGDEGAGLVPVASDEPRDPHRRPGRWGDPDRLTRFGNRACAVGQGGEDDMGRRFQKLGTLHCRHFLSLAGDLIEGKVNSQPRPDRESSVVIWPQKSIQWLPCQYRGRYLLASIAQTLYLPATA